jgi:hypothetical protein
MYILLIGYFLSFYHKMILYSRGNSAKLTCQCQFSDQKQFGLIQVGYHASYFFNVRF